VAMSGDERPRERRTRGLLSSYYGVGANSADPLDLDGPNFNADKYVSRLLENQSLSELVHKGSDMVTEIKSLDSDMQMLVYTNYNKFISATDTIRAMKHKVEGMEDQMNQLASNMESIIEGNKNIASNVTGRRGQLEQLNGVRKLLVKLQFLFDLPAKLQACVEEGEHERAVRYYHAATNILRHYGHMASFQPIHDEAVEIISRLKRKLHNIVADDTTSLQTLGESVGLLLDLAVAEDELLTRYTRRATELVAVAIKEGLAEDKQPGPGAPVEEMEAYSSKASAVYVPAALELISTFARLFLGLKATATLGSSAAAASASTATHITGSGAERKLATLHQCVGETFDTFADTITEMVQAVAGGGFAAMDALTCAIRALNEAAQTICGGSDAVGVSLVGLEERAAALGADLARGGITGELASFAEDAFAVAQRLVVDAAAPGDAACLVRLDALREHVTGATTQFMARVDSAMQAVRPLLLALPHQGLVRGLVEQLMAAILAVAADLREGKLQLPGVTGEAEAQPSAASLHSEGKAPAADGEADAAVTTPALAGEWTRVRGEAATAFLACALCTELATRMHGELQRLVSGHIMFARREYSAPLPVGDIVHQLERAAQELNAKCISLLASEVDADLQSGVAGRNWLQVPQPRAVSPFIDAILSQAVRALTTFNLLFADGGTAARTPWVPSGAPPAPKEYSSRTGQNQHSASVIHADMDRLFARKVSTVPQAVDSPKGAVGLLLRLSLKSTYEHVRTCTLGQHGYQQLQVDMHVLRWTMAECVDDQASLQALVDEVMTSAHERCLQPVNLEPEVLEALCEAKRQHLISQAI